MSCCNSKNNAIAASLRLEGGETLKVKSGYFSSCQISRAEVAVNLGGETVKFLRGAFNPGPVQIGGQDFVISGTFNSFEMTPQGPGLIHALVSLNVLDSCGKSKSVSEAAPVEKAAPVSRSMPAQEEAQESPEGTAPDPEETETPEAEPKKSRKGRKKKSE